MIVINIADLDKTCTDHLTSAYNWLFAQSESIEEQRKIALTQRFQNKLAAEEVAPWIEPFTIRYLDSPYMNPIATFVPTGRWEANKEVTEGWICCNHGKLGRLLGLHVEVKCLNFKDYQQYIADKFYEIRKWLGEIFVYKKLYAKPVQINVYDDTFDIVVRVAQSPTFATSKIVPIWIDHGVPKRLAVVDAPKDEKSWVSMLEG